MAFLKERSVATKRDQLMTVAERAFLEKGFAATSIDELIAEVGITKSGFFYHFNDKSELAKQILKRHQETEDQWFDALFQRAQELNEDPLHGFLVFLKLLQEDMENLPDVHPGCILSMCCYQENLFDSEVRKIAAVNLIGWRRRIEEKLREIAVHYPPRVDVDLQAVADMLAALIDGAIMFAKIVREKEVLPRQVALYRQFVQLIFLGPTSAPRE